MSGSGSTHGTAAGNSHAPVYTDELDDADRTVSVLVLIGRTGTVANHPRPTLALPESLNAVAVLRDLQTQAQQLALIVAEHGGVEGIMTVEDSSKELAGEIYDEHDRDILSNTSPTAAVCCPARSRSTTFEDLDISIPAHTKITTSAV